MSVIVNIVTLTTYRSTLQNKTLNPIDMKIVIAGITSKLESDTCHSVKYFVLSASYRSTWIFLLGIIRANSPAIIISKITSRTIIAGA